MAYIHSKQLNPKFTGSFEYSGSIRVTNVPTGSTSISANNITAGYPGSYKWGSGLDGSYFNRFTGITHISDILRFMSGVLSHSLDVADVAPNTKTYASIDSNENTLGSTDSINGYVPQNFSSIGSEELNYLNGKGGERGHRVALEQIFGREYVNNLDILNTALQITGRKAASRAAEGTFANIFTDIMRTHLGQFSKPGRILTALRRAFTGASNRVIKNALLNPQSLSELIELKKLSPSSKRAAIILSKLGGNIFLSPEGEVIEPIPDDQTSIDTSNIDEIIQTTENIKTATLPEENELLEMENVAQLPTPPLQTPGINPASFDKTIMAQGTVDQTGLTSSELAFLDDEEKAMRLRQRGMA